MDTYEAVTYLQIPGEKPRVLHKALLEVKYHCDDRQSFVYTRTRRLHRIPDDSEDESVFDRHCRTIEKLCKE